MRRFSPWIVLMVLAVSLLTGCGEARQPLEAGHPMPAFRLPALDGSTVTSESLQGEPLILNFWATWCQPCQHEIPELQHVAQEEGVRVVGIALDTEGEPVVAPFVKKKGMTYTILLGNQQVFSRFDGFGIPFTVVADSEGTVINLYRGRVSREVLLADVRRIRATERPAGAS